MAKNTEHNEEVIVDVEQVYSKTEHFIEENKSTLSIVIGAIAVLIGGYFAYQNFYLAPLQEEALEEMFMAEKYFKKDSMNLAINGDGLYPGFIEIADNYSGTKAGNLAHYYLGMAYLRTGQYEAAITSLNDFSADDVMLSTLAIGAQGDAYNELGDLKKAASYYDDAAYNNENDFTTPMFLMKAGRTYELMGEYENALSRYTEIKEDYKKSVEFGDADKLIARVGSYVN